MLTVATFYRFTPFDDPKGLVTVVRDLAEADGIKGTVLLAHEGINGTVSGPDAEIHRFIRSLRSLPGCSGLEWKKSHSADMPFGRLKVRLKREIVTMGQPNVDPTTSVGTYVDPSEWNGLIAAEDVAVIDTRNNYEVAIGTFEGAVDPETASFRDFPNWWAGNAERFRGKRIAMFCTGGIRCEKATNWLMSQGVPEVFHLKGGVLKYLEDVPEGESLWRGECFVFDQRVSVGHGLTQGSHTLCHACRRPLAEHDRIHSDYEEGVQCASCRAEFTDEDRERFRERQRQVELAIRRGALHLGATL